MLSLLKKSIKPLQKILVGIKIITVICLHSFILSRFVQNSIIFDTADFFPFQLFFCAFFSQKGFFLYVFYLFIDYLVMHTFIYMYLESLANKEGIVIFYGRKYE